LLSALKPAEDGEGAILRVLNPTDAELQARVQLGFECSDASLVRLDESPVSGALVDESPVSGALVDKSPASGALVDKSPASGALVGESSAFDALKLDVRSLRFAVPPHALRSIRLAREHRS
jgi:hypothetical protein